MGLSSMHLLLLQTRIRYCIVHTHFLPSPPLCWDCLPSLCPQPTLLHGHPSNDCVLDFDPEPLTVSLRQDWRSDPSRVFMQSYRTK